MHVREQKNQLQCNNTIQNTGKFLSLNYNQSKHSIYHNNNTSKKKKIY